MVQGGGVLGSRFFAVRNGPAWHDKGTVFRELYGDVIATAVEAYNMTEGEAEVQTKKFTLVAVDDDGQIVYEEDDQGVPVMLAAPGKGLFRMPVHEDPRYQFWNHVSDDHMSITNLSVCEAVDASGLTKEYPVETMGVLDEGKCFFLTLDCGEWEIKGDPMQAYLFVREGKDGKRSFQIAVTNVRVVCTNTERMALENADINLRVLHNSNIHQNIAMYTGMIGQIKNAQMNLRAMRQRLADFKFTTSMANEVFEAAWPTPPLPEIVQLADANPDVALSGAERAALDQARINYEKKNTRVTQIREAAVDLLGLQNEQIVQRELAGTGHIVFNVVTELANYRKTHKTTIADSILIGSRVAEMTRGFDKALALTN